MLSKLTSGLDDKYKEEFLASRIAGLAYRKRVTDILEKELHSLQDRLVSSDLPSSPSFQNEVIDIVAEMRSIKKMLTLLK